MTHKIPVINHELERREERLEKKRNNDIWEYRTAPPGDWNRGIPVHLTTDYKSIEEDKNHYKQCVLS